MEGEGHHVSAAARRVDLVKTFGRGRSWRGPLGQRRLAELASVRSVGQ